MITFQPKYVRVALIIAGVICLLLSWGFIRWNLANVVALQVDHRSPDSRSIADWLTAFSPSDPRTHVFAAKVYETTFDPDDLNRAVLEYEVAASLSPHNYVMWLNLGRARALLDDSEGAFKAYERALELAPNYSIVRWVYGNALLRVGRLDDGLALVSKAADLDPQYSRPAISTALQVFDGNIDEVRRTMGDKGKVNAGLAEGLLAGGRIEEAFDSWQRLSPESRRGEFKTLGETLRNKTVELKRFRIAARIQGDISDGQIPAVSRIVNGGFEEEVKLGGTDIFDWRISNGSHPQVGLSDVVKRSGRFGLLLVFSSFETAGFRSIDQTIAVEPYADYELEIFFRSDLRTDASLKWEVADATTSLPIVETPPINKAAPEWTRLSVRFKIPGNTDGVQIRLVRQGCGGPACPMSGRLIFDDISLNRL